MWWAWIAAGLLLAIVEVLAPGFIFLGFALGAIAVGVVMVLVPLSGIWAFLAFAVFSLGAVVALRAVFGRGGRDVRIIRHDINDN